MDSGVFEVPAELGDAGTDGFFSDVFPVFEILRRGVQPRCRPQQFVLRVHAQREKS